MFISFVGDKFECILNNRSPTRMNILNIAPSRTTPEVLINTEDHILLMKGRSSPENAVAFFDQVKAGIRNYFQSEDHLSVHFMFEYFNTSSSKSIFEVIKLLKRMISEGKSVSFNWVYESYDDDMLETGEDYADLLDVDMDMIEVEDMEEYTIYQRLAS
jgi:hypothetical protein